MASAAGFDPSCNGDAFLRRIVCKPSNRESITILRRLVGAGIFLFFAAAWPFRFWFALRRVRGCLTCAFVQNFFSDALVRIR